MARLAAQAKTDLIIRQQAMQLVAGVPPKHWEGEIGALFEFVRDRVRYTRDINRVETVQGPQYTLEVRHGDCDDKVTLLAALLESIGYPTRYVAMGTRPGFYQHVFLEVQDPKAGWIALDPTEPVAAGWRPPVIKQRMVQEVL